MSHQSPQPIKECEGENNNISPGLHISAAPIQNLMMKTLLYSAAILTLASIVDAAGFCDACAKSKRDCDLCKVTTNKLPTEELRKSECESVRGPCFWNTNEEGKYKHYIINISLRYEYGMLADSNLLP